MYKLTVAPLLGGSILVVQNISCLSCLFNDSELPGEFLNPGKRRVFGLQDRYQHWSCIIALLPIENLESFEMTQSLQSIQLHQKYRKSHVCIK